MSGTVIKLKYSDINAQPPSDSLVHAEPAYSFDSDRLFIGKTDGVTVDPIIIGGKYFTDKLDHTLGELTASSAILVDSNKHIDELIAGGLTLTTSGGVGQKVTTISTDIEGSSLTTQLATAAAIKTYVDNEVAGAANLSVAADSGDGQTIVLTNETLTIAGGTGLSTATTDNTVTVTIDNTGVVAGTYGSGTEIPTFSVNAQGQITSASTVDVATDLAIAGDSGTDTVSLLTDTLSFNGGDAITAAVTDNTVTISVNDSEITNAKLENTTVTFGTTEVELGSSSTSIDGVTELTVDNLNINGNTISSTNTDGDISLNPDGTGSVDVNGARITTVADPVSDQDAANKRYVDEVAQGLSIKPAVHAATTGELTATYDNGTDGVGATLNLGPAATLDIDGVTTWAEYDGVLVKDQSNEWENGRYVIHQVGDAGTDWILRRCSACDEVAEIPSMYVFVQEGTVYANTGWVATVGNVGDFEVGATDGTGDISFTQFSGAGTYEGGDGLDLTGTTFSVNVAANGGIEIDADALQLKSSLSGAGLTLTDGVLDVVGTADRITVNADSIDIASTYVGQSSITTLGTVTTGTWNADVIDEVYGGTGHNVYAVGDILYASGTDTLTKLSAGSEGQVLQVNASGVPVWGDIDGGTF